MGEFQLLWRTEAGEYVITPWGHEIEATYIGSFSQLVTKYREKGRDWFVGKLAGLPPEVLAGIEQRSAAMDRQLARAEAAAAAAQKRQVRDAATAAVWAD